MKPGHVNWATNDSWASGPDAGDSTKLEPPTAQQEDGYYTSRRPSPQIINYLLNRYGLNMRGRSASAIINNIEAECLSTSALAGAVLDAIAYDQKNGRTFAFYRIGSGDFVRYTSTWVYGWWRLVQGCNQTTAASTRLDADASDDGRVCVVSMGATSHVRESIAGAAFSTPGLPPSTVLNWGSIACDRNTAGGASALWIVGDRPGGGACSIARSTTASPGASSWSIYGSWPTITEDIDGIWHSCHPAGALGPDDPGNPTWLFLTPTYAVRSSDGLSYTSAAHGLTGTFDRRCAAYSRTSQRWVVMPGGGGAGDIAYSDDAGATWTTLSGALALPPDYSLTRGVDLNLVCDGHGSFIAFDGINSWCSVDEGLTWQWVEVHPSGDDYILGSSVDQSKMIDERSFGVDCFWYLRHDSTAPLLRAFHTLGE